MKLVKKIVLLLVLSLSLLLITACNDEASSKKKVLIVGTPHITGDFIDGWGNSRYDIYVRDLIHGYSTLVIDEHGKYHWDTTAVLKAAPVATTDAQGNKTYIFQLQEDLKYNNGDNITAKDYVANMLIRSSQDWKRVTAGLVNMGLHLVGYSEFNALTTVLDEPFSGVRMLGDYKFSLTIDNKHLPTFWEFTMINSYPIHIPSYIPGFDIKDDGQGAYITSVDGLGTLTNTLFTTTAKSPDGNRYQPIITTGPYQFVSFYQQQVKLEKNPNFKTCFEGLKPQIDEIIIKIVEQETDVNQVIEGEIDIITDVFDTMKINKANNNDKVNVYSYYRNGYGLLAFMCYHGPTQYKEVRQALGHLIDRNEFLESYIGGMGTIVDGPYGKSQWFYQESIDELDLIDYKLDPNKANQLLDQSPYHYEEDGVTIFDPAKATSSNNYYRYNENQNILHINYLTVESSQDNIKADFILQNAWKTGVSFNTKVGNWNTLMDHYFYAINLPEAERIYHIFQLSTGFTPTYDPYRSWHGDLAGTTSNPYGLNDPRLNEIIERMNSIDPNEEETWRLAWVEFVVLWNELLPNLPLYSNEYFDVYSKRMEGYKVSPTWSWAKNINHLKITI